MPAFAGTTKVDGRDKPGHDMIGMMTIREKHAEDRLRSAIEAYHASALAFAAVKLGLPQRMAARPWTAEALAAALGLSPPTSFASCAGS